MKIAVWLEQEIAVGGGFHQSVNGVIDLKAVWEGELVIYTPHASNQAELKKLGFEVKVISDGLFDRFFSLFVADAVFPLLQRRLKWRTRWEKRFAADGVGLVYFTAPSSRALWLQVLPYVFTMWDMCHLDHPEFSEVREYGEFERREHLFRKALSKSLFTLVDSSITQARAAHRYGVDIERLLVAPFSMSPFISQSIASSKEYDLPSDYLFYPAQFWSHKNHRRLIEALKVLKDNHSLVPQLVLAGGDAGEKAKVQSLVKDFELESQVTFLGFVPGEDLAGLYRQASALVMPSYFGPTNIPPMEAWSLGVPVIYSSECAEQAGSGALLFDPDSCTELAEAIRSVLQPGARAHWEAKGRERLARMAEEHAAYRLELGRRLRLMAGRLRS